jgi:hypothetical protein
MNPSSGFNPRTFSRSVSRSRWRRLAVGAVCSTSLLGSQLSLAARGAGPSAVAQRTNPAGASSVPVSVRPHSLVPLAFEANDGQADPRVKFLAHGSGYTLFLTSSDAVLVHGSDAVRMAFGGASARPHLSALERMPGVTNYLLGNDPTRWRTQVATYAKVRYDEIYPGIDLVFYGNDRQLEYDLIVHPGADTRQIRLTFDGARELKADANGDLVARTARGEIRLRRPTIYEEPTEGQIRRAIDGRYRVTGKQTVAFDLGTHDRGKTLVIDPEVVYSTYLGGSGTDQLRSTTQMIAVDANGSAYVTGTTDSPFPFASGLPARTTAFVAKLSPDGGGLIYTTYVGGSVNGEETSAGIAVDSSGSAYITGFTSSDYFPGLSSPGVFVAKLDPSGSQLLYAVKAAGAATSTAIAVGSDGSAYVTGVSYDPHLATPGAFQTGCNACNGTEFGGGPSGDAFVLKFNPAGIVAYGALIGGLGQEIGTGIAVDPVGQAYLTGTTTSIDFPRTGGPLAGADAGVLGGGDVFVTKLSADGSALIFSTYLSGDQQDTPGGIAADAAGNSYVTGTTESAYFGFPTTPGAFQRTLPFSPYHVTPAFVTKFTPTGDVAYSTLLVGTGLTRGVGIAVDAAGRAYVVGGTDNTDFPTVDATQPSGGVFTDAFVSVLNPAGSGLVFSTYLGGPAFDFPHGVAVGPNGSAYVVGDSNFANGGNFPTTTGAFQQHFNAASTNDVDVFVTRIAVGAPPDLLPPVIGDVADRFAEATSASGAVVTFDLPATTDNMDPHPLVSATPASGSTFPLGITTVTVTATDASANSSQKTFTVTVRDTAAPTIGSVIPSHTELWPPNNKMVPLSVAVSATDLVTASPACRIADVSSNEPGSNEWQVTGPLTLNLMASRNGSGIGRTYTIGVRCADTAGNSSAKSATVVVPHDQRK